MSIFNFKLAQGLAVKDETRLKLLGRVYFFVLFIYSGLEFTMTFLTHVRFNYNASQQGRMLFFIGLTMAMFQGGLMRRIGPGKEKMLALIGLAVMIPSFIIIGVAQSTGAFYLGLLLYSLSQAITIPCLTAMTAAHGRVDQKGIIMGILRSLGALARAFGPLTSSLAFFVLGASPCYVIGACCLIVPMFILRQVQL